MPVLSCRRLVAIAVPAALAGLLLIAAPAQAQQQPDPLEEWRQAFEGLNQDWQHLVDDLDQWFERQAGRYGQPPQVKLPPEPQFPRQPGGAGNGDGGQQTPTSTTEAPADEGGEEGGEPAEEEGRPAEEGATTEPDPVTALLGVLGLGGDGTPADTPADTPAGQAPACDAALCPAQPGAPKDEPAGTPEDHGGQIVTAPQFGVQAPRSADAFDAGILLGPTVLVTTNPKPLDLEGRRTTTDPLDLDGLRLTDEPAEPGGLEGITGIFGQGSGSTAGGWGGGNLDGLVVNQPSDEELTKPDIFFDPGPQDPRRVGGAIDLLG